MSMVKEKGAAPFSTPESPHSSRKWLRFIRTARRRDPSKRAVAIDFSNDSSKPDPRVRAPLGVSEKEEEKEMKMRKSLMTTVCVMAFIGAANAQQSVCEAYPKDCPGCGHVGQEKCPTWAEEEQAGKNQGCHQAGVGSAYVHFTHKPGDNYVQMSTVVGKHPAWSKYAGRVERKCLKSNKPISPWAGVNYVK